MLSLAASAFFESGSPLSLFRAVVVVECLSSATRHGGTEEKTLAESGFVPFLLSFHHHCHASTTVSVLQLDRCMSTRRRV